MRRLLMSIACVGFAASLQAGENRYFDDATLRAVQFFDAKEGWAVGDEGVILHTIDGGQSWERQPTGSRASLRSVHFLNESIGWVVGREELPGGGSVGVVFWTRDGGWQWKRQLVNSLPGLNVVRFLSPTVNPNIGFLLGDSSDQFSTGIFKTTDGGRSWEPVKGPRFPSWLAADFRDPDNALLAGAWGKLGVLRKESFGAGQIEKLDGRSIFGLLSLPNRALAIGQGGVVLASSSGGESWGFVDLKLPAEARTSLDFHAMSSVGPKVWITGRPGSVVLHSPDQGANWTVQKTKHSLPLHGLYFLDDQRGWAVGDAGAVLHTSDGGQTWKTQRQGGKRAAMLFVHAHPHGVPADTLARLGADEGYLATGIRVVAGDPGSMSWKQVSEPQRFSAGVRLAGGLTGESFWQFPLPYSLQSADKRSILDHWQQMHAGEADRELLRQLVLTLRTWKPSVIVGDHPDARFTGSGAASLIQEALAEAVQQAGNPKAYPEQLELLGLEPWRVGKLYAVWEKKDAHISFDNHETKPILESSYRDFAQCAARILSDGAPIPNQRFYRLLASSIDGAAQQLHFMDSLPTSSGDARRPYNAEEATPEAIQATQARRNLMVLAEKIDDKGQSLAQIGQMLKTMPDDQAASAAFAIAGHFARQGQWFRARESYLLMVERYPMHSLAVEAYRWLIRHAGSSEARRRHELGQFLIESTAGFEAKNPNLPKDPKEITQVHFTEPTGSSKTTLLGNVAETRHWYRGSLLLSQKLSAFGPLYETDPAVQFCLQASRRQLGEPAQAQEWCQKFVQHFPPGSWHEAAVTELWLLHRSGTPPKRVAACKRVEQKPFLDGVLNDSCWEGMKPFPVDQVLSDATRKGPAEPGIEKTHPTDAYLGYDDRFLYIALRCKHPEGKQVPLEKNRTRDAYLEAYDRVSILLDLDRDYSTCFHLQVDQRGCVREDCWGDASWNPKWFVAAQSTKDGWTIEAALPLAELTGERVTLNTAWACNIIRTMPGRGLLSWSKPADAQPRPEDMGVIVFEQEKKR